MHNPAYLAIAAACAAALAAVNIAHTIRRRRRRQEALELAQLVDAEQRLTRQIRAAQRRTLDLTVAGEFAALGSDAAWQRFLGIHPELRAGTGQKGGPA